MDPAGAVQAMGMGATDHPPATAEDWNGGSCDIMAVALHRIYGLPLMAEFEYGLDGEGREVPGYLVHAWVRLPDGRALDAAGPRPMFVAREGADPDDAWVIGYRVAEIRDDDPHLLETREETDYVGDIRDMRAAEWIEENLEPDLRRLGLSPIELEGSQRFQELVRSMIADLRRPPVQKGAPEARVRLDSFPTHDCAAAEVAQLAFDTALDRVREEGRRARQDAADKESNPYRGSREPHLAAAWAGGWAEVALDARFAPAAPGRR
jgi:hypothetical protein